MADEESRGMVMKVSLWVVTVVASLAMLAAGASKFLAAPMWDELFIQWGYGVGFKTLIGIVEIVGALALLAPRVASYAGLVICVVMLGAIYTVWSNQSDLGYVASVLNLTLFGIVAVARWNGRWTPGG
ncbi:MAG: DoxX family protein [Gemmatimonadetes bacterium]|nr:DoxX family protein [Gemmatimonadota bacterium]